MSRNLASISGCFILVFEKPDPDMGPESGNLSPIRPTIATIAGPGSEAPPRLTCSVSSQKLRIAPAIFSGYQDRGGLDQEQRIWDFGLMSAFHAKADAKPLVSGQPG